MPAADTDNTGYVAAWRPASVSAEGRHSPARR
jgi:hypothetical protein